MCAIASTGELKQLLAGTASGRLFDDPGAERTRESVRNTLLTSVRGLQLLHPDARADEGFSITRWVQTAVEQDGAAARVFLFCPPELALICAMLLSFSNTFATTLNGAGWKRVSFTTVEDQTTTVELAGTSGIELQIETAGLPDQADPGFRRGCGPVRGRSLKRHVKGWQKVLRILRRGDRGGS